MAIAVAVFAGGMATTTASAAGFTQQKELTASDGVATDAFGNSVSTSGDGSTALVGADGKNVNGHVNGAAYVFIRSGSTWSQAQELTASDDASHGNYFGYSVSLSSDGSTALIGAIGYEANDGSGVYPGAAYVFTRSGSTWSQQQKLIASDGAHGDKFGSSVSLSSDGGTALIGAEEKNSFTGAAYVFTRSGSTWSQAQELTASDGTGSDSFGASVSLSGDGSTALIGAYHKNNFTGAAYVFTRSGSTWSQQQKLTASDAATGDQFGGQGGSGVSLNGDGSTALIGASGANLAQGAAYVFTRSGSTWSQQQKLTESAGRQNDAFGFSVSLNGNATTALIGAFLGGTGSKGASYVFTRSGSTWSQQQQLTASDAGIQDDFGRSVSLSGDGSTGLIGAFVKNNETGAAYVFAGPSSASLQDAPSTQQYYLLNGSDGITWHAMDTNLLADTFIPTNSGTAVLSANADLWTFNAGFNQDIGICLLPGAAALATCPAGDLVGWKESGGFAGTFSPNAAYVQATAPVTAGTTYTAFIVWKANKAMPAGDTIAVGAGSSPTFSPTRLTVSLPDGSNVESDASSTQQYSLHGSDGSTWNYVDATALKLTLSPGSAVSTVLSANADMWTVNAGFNQDIGICVAAGATLPSGSCPSTDVVAWKESGGYAGTFSPNAAFTQTVVPMTAGTYSVALVWKANKMMPGGDTIVIGAGSSPTFSPSRLTARQYSASGTGAAGVSSAQQYVMNGGSDGATWQVLDATHLSLTVAQVAGCRAAIGGNVDLWTVDAGFNQDIGIQVTPAGGTPYVASWKESGGYAGTFSPNAAFVEAVIPISDATSYSITLVWKTNKPMLSSRHIAAAAGSTGAFSPTTLTATEHC